MIDEPIHQPHDKLFKASFSDPVNAAAFLRWEVPANLAEKVNWDQLRLQPGSYIDSQFRLIQLANLPFTALHGTPAGVMTLRVMKAERLNDLLNNFVWDEPLMLQLPQLIRERLLLYIIHGGIDIELFYGKIQTITNLELQSTAMSLAQQLLQRGHQEGHQEGRQEGRLQGRQEGLQSSVIEALEIRFDHVPVGLGEAIRRIQDEAHLHLLHKASIKAITLEEFAKQL